MIAIEIILHRNSSLVYCKNMGLPYFSPLRAIFVHFSLCDIFVHGLNRYGINIVEKKVPGILTKNVLGI